MRQFFRDIAMQRHRMLPGPNAPRAPGGRPSHRCPGVASLGLAILPRDPFPRSARQDVPAVHIGGPLPFFLPLALLALGILAGSTRTRRVGWAVAQAEVMGLLISSGYKALTCRAHPAHVVAADLSRVFKFGFLRGGVFWGWPSSHTTIAFAMAVTIFTLFPKQRWAGCVALAYALYVGVGVSMTIHWFSDFVAGALIGTAVGLVVGRRFSQPQA